MMNLVTAVEQFYQDKPVPRLTVIILTDICRSAADGETENGIARRLDIDVYEVRDVIRKNHELAGEAHTFPNEAQRKRHYENISAPGKRAGHDVFGKY